MWGPTSILKGKEAQNPVQMKVAYILCKLRNKQDLNMLSELPIGILTKWRDAFPMNGIVGWARTAIVVHREKQQLVCIARSCMLESRRIISDFNGNIWYTENPSACWTNNHWMPREAKFNHYNSYSLLGAQMEH